MTPFGSKVRSLRKHYNLTQKQLADKLGLSAAYLSALEHGHRGRPSRELVHDMCAAFGLIWEDADELQKLAQISHPRIVVDTSGLSPEATILANTLAETIHTLPLETLKKLNALILETKTEDLTQV